MKIKHRTQGYEAISSRFNIHSMGEVIVTFNDGSQDSMSMNDFDVWIGQRNEWMSFHDAFDAGLIDIDNLNTVFREAELKEKGQILPILVIIAGILIIVLAMGLASSCKQAGTLCYLFAHGMRYM